MHGRGNSWIITQGSTHVRGAHRDATLGYDGITALRYRGRTIAATDREINRLVYEFYGLTEGDRVG
jgi:uncharacterized Rossmann fold enzyme